MKKLIKFNKFFFFPLIGYFSKCIILKYGYNNWQLYVIKSILKYINLYICFKILVKT